MNWTLLVNTYLTQKRKLGYSLHSEGNYLKSFAHYAQQDDTNHFTVALALRWANLAPSKSSIAIARRFGVLRPFSVYLSNIGYDCVILPTHFMGPTHRRLPPYIYSQSEIAQLMQATNKLYPENGLRPVTLKIFIGLLACTGLRPGEAVRLHNADVDLNKGLITVNNSKGWKQRIISLSPSASDELKAYVKRRDQINSSPLSMYFFKLDYQRTLTIRAADYAFVLLRESIGLPLKLNGRYPRLYDIRHTFVCQRISSWYQAGVDVDSKIAQLSYYLGHKKVSDTYWYITAIPQLMAYAAKRFNGSLVTGGSK